MKYEKDNSINRKEMYLKDFFVIICALLLSSFLYSTAHAKDKINLEILKKLGVSNPFLKTAIVKTNDPEFSTIAYCGTEKGLVIINITDLNASYEIFRLNIGKVFDITFHKLKCFPKN